MFGFGRRSAPVDMMELNSDNIDVQLKAFENLLKNYIDNYWVARKHKSIHEALAWITQLKGTLNRIETLLEQSIDEKR